MVLREPRPAGFPLLFTADCQLIEPAVAFLHEHFIQRAHTADTLRTYAEILYDWFETLEQNAIAWREADAVDLVAYRNRMLSEPSGHTGRPYRISTINHRVRGVLRFYEWLVRNRYLDASPLASQPRDFAQLTWLDLPDHDGEPWRLTTHQGRKTLCALRGATGSIGLVCHRPTSRPS